MRRPIIAMQQQQPPTHHRNPPRRLRSSSRIRQQQPAAALLLVGLTLLLPLLYGAASSRCANAMPLAGSRRQQQQPMPTAFLQPLRTPIQRPQRAWTRPSSPSSAAADPASGSALAAKGGGGKGGGGGVGREELKNAMVAEGLEEILAARAVEAADKAVVTWETQVGPWCVYVGWFNQS